MAALAKAFLLLTVTFFVIGSAVIGIVRLSLRSPLAPYEASMSGLPLDRLQDYSCLLRFSVTNDSASVLCEFTGGQGSPKDSPVKTLVIQSDNLRLGDLFLCLGVPDGIQFSSLSSSENLVNLFWSDQSLDFLADRYHRQLDDFLPITYLSIEGKGSLCPSS